jgi:hypothetical protein
VCGNDGVTADKGPWDVIAERALYFPDSASEATKAPYLPDFSAFALTASVSCLCIEHADVERICVGRGDHGPVVTVSPGRVGRHAAAVPALAVPQQANGEAVGSAPEARAIASDGWSVAQGHSPPQAPAAVSAAQNVATGVQVMDRVHLLTEADVRDVPDFGTLLPSARKDA